MAMLRRRCQPFESLVPLLLLFLLVAPCVAQDDNEPVVARGVLFPPGDREFRQALGRATKAVDEERYDDALEVLGALLTPSAARDNEKPVLAEDFFIAGKQRGTLTSFKGEAMRLLDRIPAQAMKQYELQHGAEAELLRQEAMKQGSADRLADVARRFFHTEAGMRASLALSRLQLESGRPLSAKPLLERLVGTPGAERVVEPEASVLLAGALHHGGESARASAVLAALRERQPNFTVPGGGRPSFTSDAEPLQWLEKLFGRPHTDTARFATQWTLFRGSPERNAAAEFAEPVYLPRWRVPVVNDPHDEQLVSETARAFERQGNPSLPSVHPLAVKQVILMRSPDRLLAVEAESGKRIWVYPWAEPAVENALQAGIDAANASSRGDQLKQRVWDDAPHGQLSSDGENVYFIGELGDSAPYNPSPRIVFDPFNRPRLNPMSARTNNRLRALSLRTQGKLLWEQPTGGVDDPLRDAFFLGPPLPVNGELYVLAEVRGEIALLALDPQQGELRWKQALAHVENSNVLADPIRRLAGASPSYASGILVCPTTAGAVVAVDVASRRLLWGTPYPRGSAARAASRLDSPFAVRNTPRYGDRWTDGTAAIVGDAVIVTPPDSDSLHCFDLLTGKERWPAFKRGDHLFVAGAREGRIVLVGKSQITLLQLADGKPAAGPLAIDAPHGRGLLDGAYYYQPTATGKLLVVDIAKGEVSRSFHTSQPLGNLVAYHDDILSLSDDCLAAYPRIDRLEKKIAESLARNAKDPWALARRGELFMHQRKWEEALVVLREANAQPKPDPAAAGLLAETILSLLEADYAKHASLSDEVVALIDDVATGNRFHRVVAAGKEAAGDHLGAFQAYLAIDVTAGSEGTLGGAQRLVELGVNWRVRNDRWIAAHLASLYQASNADQRAAMDSAILAQFKAMPHNSATAMRLFVQRFGYHPVARQAQLALAAYLVESNNLLEAERLLQPLTSAQDRHVAARAWGLLGKSLQLAHRWPEAVKCYQVLGSQFAEVEALPGQTGGQVRDEAAQQFEFRQALAAAERQYPRGRAVVEADERNTVRHLPEQRRVYPLALLQANLGNATPPHLIFDPLQNILRVRNAHGHDIAVLNLNRADDKRFYSNVPGFYTARLSGHLLVIATGTEVIAIDLLRSRSTPGELIAWRSDLIDVTEQGVYNTMQARNVPNPWTASRFIAADSSNRPLGSVTAITANGMCFIKHRQLVCVDPLTGETLWSRDNVAAGTDLIADDDYLFAVPHNGTEATVYRMTDGELLGTRKVEPFARRLASSGRRVLGWSQGSDGLKLQLDDVWEQKTLWSETAPAGSRAWLCSPDEVAMITPLGKFSIRSLLNDSVKIELQLEAAPALRDLFVLKGAQQYLVAVSVPPVNASRTLNIQAAPGGNHAPLFTGKLYSVDALTGQLQWPVPAAISQMSLPLDQPLDQPVLLLMRNVQPRSGGESRKMYTSLLCLDKRTGAVLWEEREVPNMTQAYELETDGEGAAVRVALPGKAVRIRFTDNPAPPEPPVQYDEAFAVQPGSGGLGGAFLRLFRPSEAPDRTPDEDSLDTPDDPFAEP
jgi:outer membrane protein assembly factor BamB